jgi:Fe-S-cluster-containing hydrogenase component 2
MRIKVTAAACTGCRLCEQVCAIHHFGEINPAKAALRIEARFPDPGTYRPHVCTQCGECMKVCREGAITRNAAGAFLVAAARCNGCGDCIPVCKPGVVFRHPAVPPVIICDFCFECTRLCNTGAIVRWERARKGREAA